MLGCFRFQVGGNACYNGERDHILYWLNIMDNMGASQSTYLVLLSAQLNGEVQRESENILSFQGCGSLPVLSWRMDKRMEAGFKVQGLAVYGDYHGIV